MSPTAAEIRLVRLPFVTPLVTANGTQTHRNAVIVRLTDADGVEGWGECAADATSYTAPESAATAFAALSTGLPAMLSDLRSAAPAGTVPDRPLVMAALDQARHDLSARRAGVPLATHHGHLPGPVEVGAVVGERTVGETISEVSNLLEAGYPRIKLKVVGSDLSTIQAVRKTLPNAPLALDANQSFDADELDIDVLDSLGLLFVEQPFGAADLARHRWFRDRSATAVCLDESVRSIADLDAAAAAGAADIIAVKAAFFGYHAAASSLVVRAREHGLGLLVGGMLESGIGRSHALALARSPLMTEPADLPSTVLYLQRDLTEPWPALGGVIEVPDTPGLGRSIDMETMTACTTDMTVVPDLAGA